MGNYPPIKVIILVEILENFFFFLKLIIIFQGNRKYYFDRYSYLEQ